MPNLTALFSGQPRLTVITATRRLARRLLHEYGQQQLANGLSAWPTPDILSWSAWVQRQWQSASLVQGVSAAVLSATQSQQLWFSIIEEGSGGLLNSDATARQSHAARQLVMDYLLDLDDKDQRAQFVYDVDAAHWLDWHTQYENRLGHSGWLDTPAITRQLIHGITHDEIHLNGPLCFIGFDMVTPLQQRLIDYLRANDIYVEAPVAEHVQADATVLCASDGRDEICRAAYWARQQFEQGWKEGDAPIGVIFPRLQQQRRQVERIFRSVFYPQDGVHNISTESFHCQGIRESSAFNLSMGYSLAEEPVIATALNILSLCHLNFSYDTFSQLLRSSFIKDGSQNVSERSALDVLLRKHTHAESSLYDLIISMPEAKVNESVSDISVIINELSKLKDTWKGRGSANQWVERIYECLYLFGWPNNDEHKSGQNSWLQQVMKSLDEVLLDFARLDHVAGDMGLEAAFSKVSRMIHAQVFQPGGSDAPVQVLGMLESAGLDFSSLWVAGMTEQEWPALSQPHPFIPIRLQKEHGLPHCSPRHEYDYAQQQTQRLLHSAASVVFSYPAHNENDETFLPSPLVAEYPRIDTAFKDDRQHEDIEYDIIFDAIGPPVDIENYFAGTAAIKDQAACPFRAFVQHRLKGRYPEDMEPGNDPRVRGQLVHRVLEDLWKEWGSWDRLQELDTEQLLMFVNLSAEKAVQKHAWRINSSHPIEQQRLVNLVMEWLEIEKQRQPFEAVAFEKKIEHTINGLKLRMYVDRIDRLADGSLCVIDYKTGEARSAQWTGERPDEPQIPLYALAQDEPVNAVMFASIRAGESKYEGATCDRALMAIDDKALSGIKQLPLSKGQSALKEYQDWGDMFSRWQAHIDELATAHISGKASVDPKSWPELTTCMYCDVKPVCRLFDWDGEEEEL